VVLVRLAFPQLLRLGIFLPIKLHWFQQVFACGIWVHLGRERLSLVGSTVQSLKGDLGLLFYQVARLISLLPHHVDYSAARVRTSIVLGCHSISAPRLILHKVLVPAFNKGLRSAIFVEILWVCEVLDFFALNLGHERNPTLEKF